DQPVRAGGRESRAGKLFLRAQHDSMRIGLQADYEARFAQCDAQTFSLADREALEPIVTADNAAIGQDDFASGRGCSAPRTNELGMIARGDKADFLAVGLV